MGRATSEDLMARGYSERNVRRSSWITEISLGFCRWRSQRRWKLEDRRWKMRARRSGVWHRRPTIVGRLCETAWGAEFDYDYDYEHPPSLKLRRAGEQKQEQECYSKFGCLPAGALAKEGSMFGSVKSEAPRSRRLPRERHCRFYVVRCFTA